MRATTLVIIILVFSCLMIIPAAIAGFPAIHINQYFKSSIDHILVLVSGFMYQINEPGSGGGGGGVIHKQ
jgi:hypothetical protein